VEDEEVAGEGVAEDVDMEEAEVEVDGDGDGDDELHDCTLLCLFGGRYSGYVDTVLGRILFKFMPAMSCCLGHSRNSEMISLSSLPRCLYRVAYDEL